MAGVRTSYVSYFHFFLIPLSTLRARVLLYTTLLACALLIARRLAPCQPYEPQHPTNLPQRAASLRSLPAPATSDDGVCSFLQGREAAVFLHVFPAHAWRPILDDTVAQLQLSPLRACGVRYFHGLPAPLWPFGAADPSFSSVTGAADSPAPPRSELDTLQALHGYCEAHPRALVSYIHGKGTRLAPEADVTRFLRQWDWRRLHLYFLVEAPQGCLRALASGRYDACGANMRAAPSPHFSGNFWWASCEHVRALPSPMAPPPAGRDPFFWPEMWLGSGGRARFLSCFDSGVDHYLTEYSRANYVGGLCEAEEAPGAGR